MSAPGLWVTPAAALAIRLAALIVIIGELASLAARPGRIGGEWSGGDSILFDALLITIGLCLLIALLAPALAAWSQLGAAGNPRPADRFTRAIILVLPAFLLMADLNRTIFGNLMSGPSLVQQLMQGDVSRIWASAGLQLPLAALTVIILSPALGAAINAARRGLQQKPPPTQASA